MQQGLVRWLVDSVTINNTTGNGPDGEPAYSGAGTAIDCKIFQTDTLITNEKGVQVVSRCKVLVEGDVVVDTHDKITMPDGSFPKIIKVTTSYDLKNKAHHKVIFL